MILRLSAISLILSLALAACGSTAQLPTNGSNPGGAAPRADEMTVTGRGAGNETGQPAGADGEIQPPSAIQDPSRPAGTSAGGEASRPSPTAPQGSNSGSPGTGPATAQGEQGELAIGLPYTENADAANSAAGSNATVGDPRSRWGALVEDINSRGGILGRTVVPKFFAYNPFGNFATQQQAACTQFTQDDPVFAVLGAGINFTSENFNACLEKAGIPFVETASHAWDADILQRYPHSALASALSLDRMARTAVAGLHAHGWFAADSRVGLVTYDDATFERVVNRALIPALAAQGVELAEIARVTKPQSNSDLGAEAAEVSSAVLRFSTRGIDRVLFLELGGDIALFFMNAAESQRYRPRYGLNSNDGGMVLAANVPAAQLSGAVGVGWVPIIDVAPADDPHREHAPRQQCFEVFTERGMTLESANQRGNAAGSCDLLGLLAAALETSGELSAPGFRRGVAGLGTRFGSALTFSTAFGPQRRDGAATYRLVAYFEECSCLRYTSGDQTAP